ncbi:unnamed protein product [Rodentolepis nana]|uniref:PWWP domain-containing protein n=1 Tax=Rodentolepis nana TaxID=102285 RepID=A0A0R3TPA2_RODNA|nr:unnamed protein product [Rodentolepis nana]
MGSFPILPEEESEIKEAAEAVDVPLEEVTEHVEDVDCIEEVEKNDILNGQEPEDGQDETGCAENEVVDVNMALTDNGDVSGECDVREEEAIVEVVVEESETSAFHAVDNESVDFVPEEEGEIEEDAEAVDVPLEEVTEHVEDVDSVEEVEENGILSGQEPEDGQEGTGCAENGVVEVNVASHEESNELVVNSEPLSNAIEEAIEEVENDVHCAETLCSVPEEEGEIKEDAEAVDVPLEEVTEHVEDVDSVEEVEENGILSAQDPEDAQKSDDGKEEIGCAETEVVDVNVAFTVNGHADDVCEVGEEKVIAEVREEKCVALTSHALEKDFVLELFEPTEKSSNGVKSAPTYTTKAYLALSDKVMTANRIEVTSQTNATATAKAVNTSVNGGASAGGIRNQRVRNYAPRVYNQSTRGPTSFQVPTQKFVDNKRQKDNLNMGKEHHEVPKDNVQRNAKNTPSVSSNAALKSTLSSTEKGPVVKTAAKATGQGGKRFEKSLKEDGIADTVKSTSHQRREDAKQLPNRFQEKATSVKSANAPSQGISKKEAQNKNSTNEKVKQNETRDVKKASKSASKPVDGDAAAATARVQPNKHNTEEQSSTPAANVDETKFTKKTKRTWKRRQQRKRARMNRFASKSETEKEEETEVMEEEEEAADVVDTQVNKTEDSAPSKEDTKVVTKPSKAKIRRERRLRARLRRKEEAAAAKASKALKKKGKTSKCIPADTSTSKVDHADATPSEGKPKSTAANASSKGPEISQVQKRNPAAQNVKPDKKGNPTETHNSSLQTPGKSASGPKADTTASKIGPTKQPAAVQPSKVDGKEQSTSSTSAVPWIVRERQRRKDLRRKRNSKKYKSVNAWLANGWIQLGILVAAISLGAFFVLFYCY